MAEERTWRPENEEEEEEEVDDLQYQSQKDAVIFAIEVSQSMLSKPPNDADSGTKRKRDDDSPTSAALKCAYELMQQRIISSPKDMIAVLLFGSEASKFQDEQSQLEHPNCYLLVDLCVPSADEVRTLRDLVNEPEEYDRVVRPSNEKVSISNVLFGANQIFTTRAPNFASRRLFIVTDDDNPHEADKTLRSSAAVRARDLYDLAVTIELFPVSKRGSVFDRSKFYNDIIYSNTPSDPDTPLPVEKATRVASVEEGIPLLQSLLSSIKARSIPKRALFSNLPLEIGPGFKISVKGYILFKKQTPARKSYVWLKGEKAEIVTNRSSKISDDSGRIVEKAEIRKAYKFGGTQISFTPEEISELRNFGEPVIRIIGFKPQSLLPSWANLKAPTFIYPSEEDLVGSTRVFSALQQKLLRDDKMALTWYIARKNAAPVLAALVPGQECANEDGDQVIPPGMWIVPLPFADDIRKDPEIVNIVAPDNVIDKMRLIVQQLQLPKAQYVPEKYPNPSLQWHYKILQALALDEEIPLQPDDKTIPKYRQIHKRAGSYVQEWGQELDKEHHNWQGENRDKIASMAAPGSKRPAAKNVKAMDESGKKIKTDDGDAAITDQEMRIAFQKQRVEKYKVSELKDWLEGKGLKAAGKKADLVARIEAHFEKR